MNTKTKNEVSTNHHLAASQHEAAAHHDQGEDDETKVHAASAVAHAKQQNDNQKLPIYIRSSCRKYNALGTNTEGFKHFQGLLQQRLYKELPTCTYIEADMQSDSLYR